MANNKPSTLKVLGYSTVSVLVLFMGYMMYTALSSMYEIQVQRSQHYDITVEVEYCNSEKKEVLEFEITGHPDKVHIDVSDPTTVLRDFNRKMLVLNVCRFKITQKTELK